MTRKCWGRGACLVALLGTILQLSGCTPAADTTAMAATLQTFLADLARQALQAAVV